MSIKINENVLKRYKSKAETFFRDSQSFAGDGKDNIKELFRSSKISAIELRNALESYILKNYDKVSGVEKSVMEEYLKVFYITFLKEPDKHLDSLLLQSSDVVSKLCPDLKKVMGDKKVSLKDTVKSTYLTKTKNWKELYTRDKNTDSLSQEEINILMHKMKSLIGSEKKEDIQMVTDYVKKMLSQYKPTNDLEDSQLEFLAKYISNRVQNDRLKQAGRQDLKEDIFIYVGTEKPNLGGYSIGDEIYLNKQSTLTENLAKFFQTVSHETEHWVQKQFAYYDDKTKAGLDAAMTDVIRDYYRKHHSEFDVYNENYRFEEIEEDAERVGSERAEYYLRDLGFEDKAQSVRSTHKNKTKARRFEYNVRRDENGNLMSRETFVFKVLDKAIKSNPDYVSEFKSLSILYELTGKLKSFDELVSGDFKINQEETRGVFEDYCKEFINQGELDNLDLSKFSEKEQCTIASRLISLLGFEEYQLSKMDKKEDAIHFHNALGKNERVAVEEFHLNVSKKIMDFMNNNYKHFSKLNDEGKFSSIIDMGYYDTYTARLRNDALYDKLEMGESELVKSVKESAIVAKEEWRLVWAAELLSKKSSKGTYEQRKAKGSKDGFIGDLLDAYDATEMEYQFESRKDYEESDIERVKKYIDSDGYNRLLIQDVRGHWRGRPSEEGFKVEYSQKQVSALVRLLKASQLLSNDKRLNPQGIDYVEKFTSIPEINYLLLNLRNDAYKDKDSYMAEMFENAKNAKQMPLKYRITEGEIRRGVTLDSIKKSIYGVRMPEIDKQTKELVSLRESELGVDSQNKESQEGR